MLSWDVPSEDVDEDTTLNHEKDDFDNKPFEKEKENQEKIEVKFMSPSFFYWESPLKFPRRNGTWLEQC